MKKDHIIRHALLTIIHKINAYQKDVEANFSNICFIVSINKVLSKFSKKISYFATFEFAFHKDIEFTRYRHSIETASLLTKLIVRNNIEEKIASNVITYGLLHEYLKQ